MIIIKSKKEVVENVITKAETLREVANKILMHDGQCTTKVWKGSEPNTLEAVSYHHDCPTGSWFTIMTLHKAKRKGLI